MFKLITASIILPAFLIQVFSGYFIRLDYYLNTASFAEKCENKTRPKMHCNGKCQMMKKMQQQEKKDQQNPERKSANKNGLLYFISFFCSLNHFSVLAEKIYFIKADAIITNRYDSIFHPPQFS